MAERKALIDGNTAYCAVRRADVDVERCLICPRLRDIRMDRDRPVLICRLDTIFGQELPTL